MTTSSLPSVDRNASGILTVVMGFTEKLQQYTAVGCLAGASGTSVNYNWEEMDRGNKSRTTIQVLFSIGEAIRAHVLACVCCPCSVRRGQL